MKEKWSIPKLIRLASQYDSVLDIGCGSGSVIKRIRAKHRIGIDACEKAISHANHGNNGVVFMVGDLLRLPNLISDKMDCVIGIDIIEHFEKEDAYQLIFDCEDIADMCLMFFIPVGLHPQTKDDRGFDNDYYQTHRSSWYPEDMEELGYTVHYFPNWHKNPAPGKEKGAMWCLKRLV